MRASKMGIVWLLPVLTLLIMGILAIKAGDVPQPIANWLSEMPQDYVGTLYVKIKTPYLPICKWHKVDAWGQLCDGTDHKDLVELMLYNNFPKHGKGYFYIEWKCKPDNPEKCDSKLSGKVENPEPYSGEPPF